MAKINYFNWFLLNYIVLLLVEIRLRCFVIHERPVQLPRLTNFSDHCMYAYCISLYYKWSKNKIYLQFKRNGYSIRSKDRRDEINTLSAYGIKFAFSCNILSSQSTETVIYFFAVIVHRVSVRHKWFIVFHIHCNFSAPPCSFFHINLIRKIYRL